MRVRIPELLRKTKINEVYHVSMLADTHDNVARLEIAVDEVARVDVLKASNLATTGLVC